MHALLDVAKQEKTTGEKEILLKAFPGGLSHVPKGCTLTRRAIDPPSLAPCLDYARFRELARFYGQYLTMLTAQLCS